MEARVQALEDAVVGIQSDIKAMRRDIAALVSGLTSLRQDVTKLMIDSARIDGRVSQMPTLIQLVTVVIAIWGMAFATLRFAGH
jgi:hypothetical protein